MKLLLAVVLAVVLLAGPTAAAEPAPTGPLPVGVAVDYQLGGARAVPRGVGIVARDRREQPVSGRFNICYVNGFQTQAEERRWWRRDPARWRLVLKEHGRPVMDEAWGEWLLDSRTPARREAIAALVGRWVRGCARAGFDAVELDNLDSFGRSHGLLKPRHALALAKLLITLGHEAGLAVGQKNWVELGEKGPRAGFDFVVAEQCGQFRECAGYVAAYGDQVVDIEYTRAGFRRACDRWGTRFVIVRRDLALSADGVRRFC